MKRNLLELCLVALLACAGTASADVLAEDSAANYTAETFVNGANLGSGFGAWEFPDAEPELADSAAGQCGDINSANGLSFRIARNAGTDWGHVYRGFEALNPGDVMTLKFSCAWDGGGRGIDLFADGDQIANAVNLGPGNNLSVAGVTVSEEYAGKAVCELALVQETDGIKIALTRVPADEGGEGNVAYWTKIETDKKLSRIGFYAGGWDWADGANVDNYALFVNDLKIEGEPPTDTLTLAGAWEVTGKETELPFKVTRQNSEGTLDVALVSSYPEFASVPNLVTIADGDTEVSFTVTATLQGRGNVATISASAEGVAGDSFEVKGPDYRVNNGSESPVSFLVGKTADIWINWDGGARDDSKLTLTADPEGVISVPTDWSLPEEGDVYVQSSVTALAPGDAALVLAYDGIEMARCAFTVKGPSLAISGPSIVYLDEGATTTNAVFSFTGSFPTGEDFFSLTLPEGVSAEETEDIKISNDDPYPVNLTFSATGTFTIIATTLNSELTASIDVTVSEPADFSSYIAYDDGSLYAGDFDVSATGVGTDKFQAWDLVTQNSGGIFLATNAPDASVLTDGAAFGIWANGADGAELQARRPFKNSLGNGQAFSVVLSPNYRDGTKGVKFMGYDAEVTHEWWQRAEFFYNNDGYFYKLEGDKDATNLGWDYSAEAIAITLQKAADGTSYTLTFKRGDETATKEGITSFGGTIDAVQFYSYQGGEGNENNLVFNKLAIEQVEEPVEPVVKRNIGIMGTWNPDATGDYDFAVGPSEASDEAIGTVALTVTPDDGRITISPASVEVPGDNVAAFTVTVNSLPAAGEETVRYTIKATPVNELVNPATFDVTPAQPYVYLSSDNNQLTTDDGPIGLVLHASPARYGEYRITTDDGNVFSIPENYQTVTLSEEQPEATFFVDIVGPSGENGAAIYATLGEGVAWCDYRFYVSEGTDVEPIVLPPASVVDSSKGRGLAFSAEALKDASLIGAYALLGEVDWTDLVENDDYVREDGYVIVLFEGKFFKGHSIGFVAAK